MSEDRLLQYLGKSAGFPHGTLKETARQDHITLWKYYNQYLFTVSYYRCL
jgi:hypothetical protein